MAGIDVLFLSKEDLDAIGLTLHEMLDAVKMGLRAHGERKVILPPKDHLPLDYPEKLFNIPPINKDRRRYKTRSHELAHAARRS